MKKYFDLSIPSMSLAADICEKVKSCSKPGSKSHKMAIGIRRYFEEHEALSYLQAKWLCHQADFYRLQRPREFLGISF
jgi:hypothetical protein